MYARSRSPGKCTEAGLALLVRRRRFPDGFNRTLERDYSTGDIPHVFVALSGSRAVEVRVEVFNLTNTPPLLAPNTTAGSAAFGTITAAGDPRVVQLAVKFLF